MGRKSDARQRILESALELMHASGYANVGVEDIMKRAGVGKSSFYHFFKSKEALGAAAIEEYGRRICEEVLDKAFSSEYSPLDRPVRLASVLRGNGVDPVVGCLAGNSAAENSTVSDKLREKTDGVLDLMRGRFADAYADAVAEMELHPDTPVEELAGASVAYFQGLLLLCKAGQSWTLMERLGPMVSNLWKPYEV